MIDRSKENDHIFMLEICYAIYVKLCKMTRMFLMLTKRDIYNKSFRKENVKHNKTNEFGGIVHNKMLLLSSITAKDISTLLRIY